MLIPEEVDVIEVIMEVMQNHGLALSKMHKKKINITKPNEMERNFLQDEEIQEDVRDWVSYTTNIYVNHMIYVHSVSLY